MPVNFQIDSFPYNFYSKDIINVFNLILVCFQLLQNVFFYFYFAVSLFVGVRFSLLCTFPFLKLVFMYLQKYVDTSIDKKGLFLINTVFIRDKKYQIK